MDQSTQSYIDKKIAALAKRVEALEQSVTYSEFHRLDIVTIKPEDLDGMYEYKAPVLETPQDGWRRVSEHYFMPPKGWRNDQGVHISGQVNIKDVPKAVLEKLNVVQSGHEIDPLQADPRPTIDGADTGSPES